MTNFVGEQFIKKQDGLNNNTAGKLQLYVFLLLSLPSIHHTQPTETAACQAQVIIFTSLFQSKMVPLLSAASNSSD